MTNSNLQTSIIRLAFAKGSDEIHAGWTKKGNITLVGEIVHSDDLVVSHYNRLVNADGSSVVGAVGTVCIADSDLADELIEDINSIQAERVANERGNKYPFVFLRVVTEGDIIFNKGVGGMPHRLSFLDVELIELESEAPDELTLFDNLSPVNNSRSAYGTVKYRGGIKAQVRAARNSVTRTFKGKSITPSQHSSVNNSSEETGEANQERLFNTSKTLSASDRDNKDQKIASLESELAQMKAMMQQMMRQQQNNNVAEELVESGEV